MADDYNAAAEKLGEVAEAMQSLDEGQLLALGHEALGIILLRTKAGKDADGHPFKPYATEYAKVRKSHGLNTTTVDLARTGHMLQSATVSVVGGEVSIVFTSEREAKKAAAHNFGFAAQVSVRGHSRKTYVNKKGQRVSAKEAEKDAKRKNKRVYQRTETVKPHPRRMNTPKREFFDVRLDAEIAALSESAGVQVVGNVEKVLKAR